MYVWAIWSVSNLLSLCSVPKFGTIWRNLSKASFNPFMRFRSRAFAANRRRFKIIGEGGTLDFLRPLFCWKVRFVGDESISTSCVTLRKFITIKNDTYMWNAYWKWTIIINFKLVQFRIFYFETEFNFKVFLGINLYTEHYLSTTIFSYERLFTGINALLCSCNSLLLQKSGLNLLKLVLTGED